MGRYIYDNIINNNSEYYRFLRNKRLKQKNIRQYGTPVLYNPGVADRMFIGTETYIWKIGDHFWKLAAQHYNDPTYWWVIAWYNGYPTEADISAGTLLHVPLSLEDALQVLGY